MRSRYFRIFILVILIIGASTACIKGCNSSEFPKQLSLSKSERKKAQAIQADSITIAAGKHYKKNKFHQIIFGSQYRDLWSLPVKMPVFNIKKEKGGMKVLKRGGSMQTLNVRLKAANGKKYVLRTVDKDQSKAIGKFWRNKVFTYIMRDETSALQPYGAFIIPDLAEAAGILHTHPKLYYIPYDSNLGKHADFIGGRVMLFEEFPDESWAHSPELGNADSIVGSTKMLWTKFSFQNVFIDQKAFAKARLFDLWMNDWDRHTDQWKWAEYIEDNKIVFKPIPRDRDMAFFKFNTGIIPKLVVIFNNKFQSFTHDFNVKLMIKNSRYIDNAVFTRLNEKDFTSISNELQKKLTDSVITNAVQTWPPEIFNLYGKETINKLIARRSKLESVAKEFYEDVFKIVKITGTDLSEKFLVERLDDNHTSVTITGDKGQQYFHYIYDNDITQEINLYGLNARDTFVVKGNVDRGVLINIHGGLDPDVVTDDSHVKGWAKKTRVYDLREDTKIYGDDETKDETTNDPDVLYYDRVGIRKLE